MSRFEDFADSIEDEQYPCDECEYYPIHLKKLKGTKWLYMEQ
tara:strand:- start:836 stop:961 length:126 start_codon:yes stop_codon:yes gene_type:complete